MAQGKLARRAALAAALIAAASVQHARRGVELGLLTVGLVSALVAVRGLLRARERDRDDTRALFLCGLAAAGALVLYPVPRALLVGLVASLVSVRVGPWLHHGLRAFRGWPPERQRRWRRRVSLSIVAAGLPLAEATARGRGIRPFALEEFRPSVVPGGSLYTPDPILGYRSRPGRFVVTLQDGYSFTLTHDENGRRVTGPPRDAARPRVWVFGCSFTHGWSVEDGETYCWLVQRALPSHEVVNFGVDGYGTLQSLNQLRSAFEGGTPEVVVLAYASFHDARNTLLRWRRKQMAAHAPIGMIRAPRFARLAPGGGFVEETRPLVYEELPLMRTLAVAHLLEIKLCDLEESFGESHEVTRRILRAFSALCRERGVRLVVATVDDTADARDVRSLAHALGDTAGDISVDPSLPGMTNAPHDSHPSAEAHRRYAGSLVRLLAPLTSR